jgi:hypothetical protein
MNETSGAKENRRGLRSDQVSGLMLIALALYVGWQNRAYPIGTLAEPGPGYLPLLLAVFLAAAGLLIVLRGGKSHLLAAMPWPEARRAAVILAACAFATLALERFGYRLTVMALLIFFLGVVERRRPVRAGIVAVAFSLISFYVIGTLLKVPLPRSPWGF